MLTKPPLSFHFGPCLKRPVSFKLKETYLVLVIGRLIHHSLILVGAHHQMILLIFLYRAPYFLKTGILWRLGQLLEERFLLLFRLNFRLPLLLDLILFLPDPVPGVICISSVLVSQVVPGPA